MQLTLARRAALGIPWVEPKDRNIETAAKIAATLKGR
jgi:hypothetical protein